jgi:ketosteroid isomerase-like protein
VELVDIDTSVASDIGLAWGVYAETFQIKGGPQEQARVRFSKVLKKETGGWKLLNYHRDIQPFDDQGVYPKSLTAVELPA